MEGRKGRTEGMELVCPHRDFADCFGKRVGPVDVGGEKGVEDALEEAAAGVRSALDADGGDGGR